ncbi:MAG: sporulation integral membrane protein YtvI [Clostridiales bacterium]|nr:sporulation integral membrane protein YtvI [Clostridiales bacterium]
MRAGGWTGKLPVVAINSLKLAGVVLGIALSIYLALRCALLLAPFLVALIVAAIVERPIRFMCHRMKMSRGMAAGVAVAVVVAVLAGLMLLISARAAVEVRDFARNLPAMYTSLMRDFNELLVDLDGKYEFITPEVTQSIYDSLSNLRGQLFSQASAISRGVWATAVSVPRVVVSVIVMLLGTFFIARDRGRIVRQIEYHLPSAWLRAERHVMAGLFSALFGYVRALMILMAVTFVELMVGLSLLNVPYALLIALLIALLDALPVLGTGTFIVPWAAYNLLTGDIRTGLGLLLVFGVTWVVRQVLEPNVVGNQIGMHPLLTLMSMYLGMQWIGVPGMILGPVVMLIARNVLRVYMNGRTLREVLFAGAEQSAEDLAKSPPDWYEPGGWRAALAERMRKARK